MKILQWPRRRTGRLIVLACALVTSGFACQTFSTDSGRALSGEWSDRPKTFSNPLHDKKVGPGRSGTACKGDLEYDESVEGPCPYYLTARTAKWREKAVVRCICRPFYNEHYGSGPKFSDWYTQGVSTNHDEAKQHAIDACWWLGEEFVVRQNIREASLQGMGIDVDLFVRCTRPTVCYKSDAEGRPLERAILPHPFYFRSSDDCLDPDSS